MVTSQHSKREKIVLQANKIKGKRCDGDTVVKHIYAQWHQCDDSDSMRSQEPAFWSGFFRAEPLRVLFWDLIVMIIVTLSKWLCV